MQIERPKYRCELRDKRKKEEHIVYAIGHTSLYLRFGRDAMIKGRNAWYVPPSEQRDYKLIYSCNFSLMRAKMHNAPKLLFDFSYDQYMTKKNKHYTASHFTNFYGCNRKDNLPFHIHICNADPKEGSIQELSKLMPNFNDLDCPLEVHRECYSELYPSKNLLYLTPYSPYVLTKYNPDDVLVIGAVVDYGLDGAITYNKAKKLGIRTAWLPLSRCVNWGVQPKNLPINIVCNIIRDFKNCGNWEKALAHVPKRLCKQPRQERHRIHELIGNACKSAGITPHLTWDEVRDQTRALDHATATQRSNPFRRTADVDVERKQIDFFK